MMENTSSNESSPTGDFMQTIKVIFTITLRQTIRSKKNIFMLIAAYLPVLLAIYFRVFIKDSPAGPENVISAVMRFYLQFLSALVALFYATSLVADEIDNKTITFLFTRPVRKYAIIAGKFLAYLLEVFLILIPSMALTYFIIAAGNGISTKPILSLGHFGGQVGVIMLALAAYGAIFTFFGAWWKRPVVLGLLFAFGWEKIIFLVPGIVRRFSVIHYLNSLFPKGKMMRQFRMHPPQITFTDSPPAFSTIILVIIIAFFLGLAIFTIYRKEYKFE